MQQLCNSSLMSCSIFFNLNCLLDLLQSIFGPSIRPFTGYYLYMDASTPATESTLYQIVSPELSQQCPMCFSFYYYMYGNETGSLNVFLYQNNTYNLVWEKQGDQGKKWLMGNVELNTDLPFRVRAF